MELLPLAFASGWARGLNAYATVLRLGLLGSLTVHVRGLGSKEIAEARVVVDVEEEIVAALNFHFHGKSSAVSLNLMMVEAARRGHELWCA